MTITDSTLTSRGRLLAAGKMLFAKSGYEQTATSAIAREAGTSESQLVRYFGGKAGLLEAIFNESWEPVNDELEALLPEEVTGRELVQAALATIIENFGRDPDLAFLFLFEGRRIRSGAPVVLLSDGFLRFFKLFLTLIHRGKEDGSFRSGFSDRLIGSALMGAAEGMIRDRLVAQRAGAPNPFAEEQIPRMFAAVCDGL